MDLRTGHRLAYRAHVRARGDDVVVYGQAVDTEDPRSRQHQLQGGVKRIAIDNDRSAGRQDPFGRRRDPRKDLDSDVDDGALHTPCPHARVVCSETEVCHTWQTLGHGLLPTKLCHAQQRTLDPRRQAGCLSGPAGRHRASGRCRESGVPNGQLYVVTKVLNADQHYSRLTPPSPKAVAQHLPRC
ncbi:Uncharacterised protein [Mycobacterium tuberculosis]|nr:Uncharacterised protein [Mycobacterium tuberculosis]CKT81262.1 Uncharacterised protein [Mycobacterium tuberculosis]CKU42746.1 Uncharacterised protein [Mycobacterium tuberculosis]